MLIRTLSRRFMSRAPRRLFTTDPKKNQEEQREEILNELNNKDKEETKSMPGFYYGAAAVLVGTMVYFQYLVKTPKKKEQQKPHVKVMGEAKIGGPWKAIDTEGNTVTNEKFLGKFVVYYFGFTRCPDICPASLQKLASAIDLLKAQGYTNFQPLFVSLDPEKDTPEKVKAYVELFHSDIGGVVVSEEDIPEFLKTFKLYSRKIYEENDYMLDHTTYMYLFGSDGKFLNVLGANLNYEELAETIAAHIKQFS